MANKANANDDNLAPELDDTQQGQVENPEESTDSKEEVKDTADVEEVKIGAPKAKNVEVRYLTSGESIVANVSYSYKKDRTGKIPSDVAAILINSGVAIKV